MKVDLRAVIFDMDGVIVDTITLHYQSWKQALKEYKIDFSPEENDRLRSLNRRKSLLVILGERELPEDAMQKILKRKNEFYLKKVSKISTDHLAPGIQRLLNEIRAAGIAVGVASASSNTRRVLERLGICDFVDVIVDANDVSISKPAPDVYLSTAERLKILPNSCLAIDDSQAGVQSATSAGMCTVGISPHTEHTCFAHFDDLSCVTLLHLIEIFEAWRSHSSRPAS